MRIADAEIKAASRSMLVGEQAHSEEVFQQGLAAGKRWIVVFFDERDFCREWIDNPFIGTDDGQTVSRRVVDTGIFEVEKDPVLLDVKRISLSIFTYQSKNNFVNTR